MNDLTPPPLPYNLANELAKERTLAAAERTLMAWMFCGGDRLNYCWRVCFYWYFNEGGLI